jgi:rhodanese-related sulfurtransferase
VTWGSGIECNRVQLRILKTSQASGRRRDVVKSAKDLVAEANSTIQTLPAQEAAKLVGASDVVFVDLREADELGKTGRLRGAVHVPRGFLEFQADPSSPTHKPELAPDKRIVLYCGSGSRSALAAKTLGEMGFSNVAHVQGGFPALRDAGAAVEH